MAYSTGTAATPSALKSAIEAFAAANGFTLSAGVLSEGISHIRLTAQDTPVTVVLTSVLYLEIEGANNATFSAGVCSQKARVMVEPANWPITYFLFAHGSPTNVFCIVRYGGNKYLHLAFGTITKHGSTITGGNWFSASHNTTDTGISWTPWGGGMSSWTGGPGATYRYSSGALFWHRSYNQGASLPGANSFLRYEMDGLTWLDGIAPGFKLVSAAQYVDPLHFNNPNVWNGQTILLPYLLYMVRGADMSSLVGEVPHCRYARIDNYNAEDIIVIGADRWKIFPWFVKTNRTVWNFDGTQLNDSGPHGLAIKYDGP